MHSVKRLAGVDFFQEGQHLARRRDVFVPLPGGLQVNHTTPQLGFFEPQANNPGVDVVHSQPVDEDIRRRIVAEHHHEDGKIAQCHGNRAVPQHG